MLQGMPVVGEALRSPFYMSNADATLPTMTQSDFVFTASARRRKVIESARCKGLRNAPKVRAIYTKTMDEKVQGTLQGPLQGYCRVLCRAYCRGIAGPIAGGDVESDRPGRRGLGEEGYRIENCY